MEMRVTRWESSEEPTEAVLRSLMQGQGLHFYAWSNGPHDLYDSHSHAYNKVIYCVTGSITFGSPGRDRQVTLHPGDRLDFPAGTLHDAVVGSEGVMCLEAHL